VNTLTSIGALVGSIPASPGDRLEIGPLSIRWYGLCIALGVLAAVWVARRRWGRWGGDPEDFTTIALIAVPAGLVGARLYHVITDWSDRFSGGRWWPGAFKIWEGGLGIPGGVLLGTTAGVLVCMHLGISWRRAMDAAAPAIPVAQAIGRLGNYFNQELFGRPTSLPWGLEVDLAFRPAGYEASSTFQPTFLYEMLWNLALAAGIVIAGRRTVMRRGKWFAIYVAGYGVGRLWVEALRSDNATHLLGLRVNIWTALVAIVGGLVWLFWGGNPVDREATRQLRAGVPESTLFAADVRHRNAQPDEESTDAGRLSEDAADEIAASDQMTGEDATGEDATGDDATGEEAMSEEATVATATSDTGDESDGASARVEAEPGVQSGDDPDEAGA